MPRHLWFLFTAGTVAPNGITRELYVQKFLPRMADRFAATAPAGANLEWRKY